SRGELGILGKRPLDLLEQPLLVLRERHGTPPRSLWSVRTNRQTVAADRLLNRKSTRGSAGREAGRPPTGRISRLAHIVAAQQTSRTDGSAPETRRSRVDRDLRLPPSLLRFPQHRLPAGQVRHEPFHSNADQPTGGDRRPRQVRGAGVKRGEERPGGTENRPSDLCRAG